jgi:hypothetical protein
MKKLSKKSVRIDNLFYRVYKTGFSVFPNRRCRLCGIGRKRKIKEFGKLKNLRSNKNLPIPYKR